jgi:hypothetical protein
MEPASCPIEGMKEAIKEAGLKFVNRDSTMEGDERRQHYIHGVPVGPRNSDGIATIVLQDAVDKAKSLKKITLLPVQDAINGCAHAEKLRPQ